MAEQVQVEADAPAVPTLADTADPLEVSALQNSALDQQPTATVVLPPTFTPAPPTATPVVLNIVAPATSVAKVTPTPRPLSPLRPTPGEPQPYLDTHRLVAFYGTPYGPSLGILGVGERESMLQQLVAVTEQYKLLADNYHVLPTFHIISTIADPHPGDYGAYSHQVGTDILDDWIDYAGEMGVAVVLDIQPGYADIQQEFNRLRSYLYNPHVHLALDSEFTMTGGGVPGLRIGYVDAAQINSVQAQLETIATEIGVNKVLIVHQFQDSMIQGKEGIADYPAVELVIDADGYGVPDGKIADYEQYSVEGGFEYGGFKLFYDWDVPLLAPADVMALEPLPAIIIYQ